MNVCLIGDGLTSLVLAKSLVNKKIRVFLYYNNKKKILNQNRTVGITANNLDFIENHIIKINRKLINNIKEIQIYNENNKRKILNFNNTKKDLFYLIKNHNFYKLLDTNLKKNKNFTKIKIMNKSFYSKIINKNKFDLIINCDKANIVSKKYFNKLYSKNYNSSAYVTIINHKKIRNNKAFQFFTKLGPLAFLPISETQTSIVYSIRDKKIYPKSKLNDVEFKKIILKTNVQYKILSFDKIEKFELKFNLLRNYFYRNILSFGDGLHQIHPLAGQGFNMTLRDIKVLLKLIKKNQDLGLQIDDNFFKTFENQTKNTNFIFAKGIDFIYEFFNLENYYIKTFSNKIFNHLNKNTLLNNLVTKYADKGLNTNSY